MQFTTEEEDEFVDKYEDMKQGAGDSGKDYVVLRQQGETQGEHIKKLEETVQYLISKLDKQPIAVANTQEEQEQPTMHTNTWSKKNKSIPMSEENIKQKKNTKEDSANSTLSTKTPMAKAVPVVEIPSLSAAKKEKYVAAHRREKQVKNSDHSSEQSPKKANETEESKRDVHRMQEDGEARRALSGVKPIDTVPFKPPPPASKLPEEHISNKPKPVQQKGDNLNRRPLDGSLYLNLEDMIAA
ncbi:hypothetical protein Moror_2260 [Moniliophthora roreri MCA 2997]|uniref:Uncharacterized protein n=1 Tax=Moniliophthora roreri (strain MCA 2997) TaxID=1381753 RepID=V2W342_MONRO|nr:hypothetical protein Moror_2260 [Moniliophthora roreri MCA 2997]